MRRQAREREREEERSSHSRRIRLVEFLAGATPCSPIASVAATSVAAAATAAASGAGAGAVAGRPMAGLDSAVPAAASPLGEDIGPAASAGWRNGSSAAAACEACEPITAAAAAAAGWGGAPSPRAARTWAETHMKNWAEMRLWAEMPRF
jgi:hypothetical protein